MKRFILYPAIAMMSFGLFSVDVSARGRNNTETGVTPAVPSAMTKPSTSTATPSPTKNTTAPRPGTPTTPSATKPGANTPSRPGTPTTNTKPSTGSSTTAPRPGTNTPPAVNNKPGNIPGNTKPGNVTGNNRPGPTAPGYNPGKVPPVNNPPVNNRPNGYMPNYNTVPPRPNTPPSYVYNRPTPPPTWRPTTKGFTLGNILGLAFGTMLSNSVNSLINNGYYVSGYNTNEVYLNDVNYLNINWPNGTLYYNRGYLEASMFSAATPSFDMTRYNYVYNTLVSLYGRPVTTNTLNTGGMSSTWWGYNNNYMTLSFYPEYLSGVGTYYFTTLTVGN